MLHQTLAALSESPVAEAITASRYIYPVINAAHIIGLATLFGSILVLDLRLLGAFRRLPLRPFAIALPRVAASGLALAVVTGLLLFIVQPLDYVGHPAFLTKVALVGLGIAHAASVHFSRDWRILSRQGAKAGPRLKMSAALSLTIWTGAIFAGRFIAF